MTEYITTIGMAVDTCCECGLTWAVSKEWDEARMEDHKTFYCPNGCSLWYPDKNEVETLKSELRRKEACCVAAKEEAKIAKAQFYGMKGYVTKLKKREMP